MKPVIIRGTLFLASSLSLSILGGCSIGPSYEQPAFTPPTSYHGVEHLNETTTEARRAQWWEGFQDELLNQLVQEALQSNLTISEAAARLAKARADRRLSQSDLLPGVQITGVQEDSEISAIRTGGSLSDRSQTIYEAGFDALWELDLWGRVRREIESSRAQENANEANLAAVQQTIAAEVIRSYLELRGAQRQIAVAVENAEAQRETVRLTQVQFDAGQVTELDVAGAKTELALTEASVPPLRAHAERSIFRLSVLLAREPGALLESLSPPREIPLYQTSVGLDAPAEMLRRRPEVLRAEEELKAATADVGVQMGDYFPKVELLGSLSVEGASWDDLTNDPTRVYSYGPRITWRGLDAGRVGNRVAGARADAEAAEARYRNTVLQALEEVEGALSQYGSERAKVMHLKEAVTNSARAVELAKRRYEAGAISLLTLLVAERRRLQAEEALAQGETQAMISLVATVKALGIPPA